jgi:hypothetical protein
MRDCACSFGLVLVRIQLLPKIGSKNMSEGDIVINPQTSMSLKDRVMIMQTKLDLPEDVSIIQILHILQTTRSPTHTLSSSQTDMP